MSAYVTRSPQCSSEVSCRQYERVRAKRSSRSMYGCNPQTSPGEMDRFVASLLAMTVPRWLVPTGVIASRRRSNPCGPVTWTALTQIHGVALEVGERAIGQRALMRRAQHDARRQPGGERFLPARRAHAPAVAGLEAGEAVLRHRGGEVVAAGLGEFQEPRRRHDADGVAAAARRTGVAATVAEQPRPPL